MALLEEKACCYIGKSMCTTGSVVYVSVHVEFRPSLRLESQYMFIDTLRTNYLVTSLLLKILLFVATSISTFTRNPSAFDPISFTDHSVEKDLFFC